MHCAKFAVSRISLSAVLMMVAANRANAEPLTYDLARDVEARSAEAKEDLGASLDSRVVDGRFVIAGPKGRVAAAAKTAERAILAFYNGRFSRRLDKAITVYLFPDAGPYQTYCNLRWQSACISIYGFYLPDERRIVLDVGPGIGTLTHELVHPILERDFPDAPVWLNEGVASLYEGFYLGQPGEIRGVKNWRLPILRAAMQRKGIKEKARPSALFGMTFDEFRGIHESVNYATARYLCLWLEQRNLLWPFYQRFRDQYATDKTGEHAFTEVVGKSPLEADAEWRRWVQQL